jgi:hypothetical protein
MYLLLFKEHVVGNSEVGKNLKGNKKNLLTFGNHSMDKNSKEIMFIIFG